MFTVHLDHIMCEVELNLNGLGMNHEGFHSMYLNVLFKIIVSRLNKLYNIVSRSNKHV